VRLLLTGASSFTGLWFAQQLAQAGHEVVAPLRGSPQSYSGLRADRVERLRKIADVRWSSTFGDATFLELATREQFDLLCHHAARVTDYRSPDFDIATALDENTRGLPKVLRALRENGLKGMVLTGSVFESDEGAGSPPMAAFSPYGVSKALTAQVARYWCGGFGIPLGKFVIPHPFGPYEEPRFYASLISTWRKGEVAEVRTPLYVRDNIHVDLLARAYVRFVAATAGGPAFAKANPSGYIESQARLTSRLAAELGPRLGLEARLKFLDQVDRSEPMIRINTEPAAPAHPDWSETAAWDGLAEFYATRS
jgi:nucleoside-diphosphate-sugar epimerase